MRVIKLLWAGIVAGVVMFILGAAFDYVRILLRYDFANYYMVYPLVAAIGGVIGAWIGGGMMSQPARPKQAKASPSAVAPQVNKVPQASSQSKAAGVKESSDVPGMPTFDIPADSGKSSSKGAERE